MSRTNFRIKVNLSRFYDDVRRSSWVYVDQSNIWHIQNLQRHIARIFDIQAPFHLLSNKTDYLSPAEDVRILKDNETVVVMPGTGLRKNVETRENQSGLPLTINDSLPSQNICNPEVTEAPQLIDISIDDSLTNVAQVAENNSVHNTVNAPAKSDESVIKEKPSVLPVMTNGICPEESQYHSDVPMNQSSEKVPDQGSTALVSNSTAKDMANVDTTVFHSMIDESRMNSESDSKATDSNVTEDYGTEKTPLNKKRKRIRRKKPKSNTPLPTNNWDVGVSETKKPKIVSALTITSGKHIRFGNVDGEESTLKDEVEKEQTVEAPGNNQNGEACGGTAVSPNLSTLLALRQTSTPITFMGNKQFEGTGLRDLLKATTRNHSVFKRKTESANMSPKIHAPIGEKSEHEAASYALTVDPQKLPIMAVKAAVKDVIAFKTLKMSSNYTPEVSNFIIAETIHCCPETWTYTFKVLAGKDQVQTPQGKFNVQLDGNEVSETSDTIVLQWAQLFAPRLICTKRDVSS